MHTSKHARYPEERSKRIPSVHMIIEPTTIHSPVSWVSPYYIIFSFSKKTFRFLFRVCMPISNLRKWTNCDARKSRRIMRMSSTTELWKSATYAGIIENGHTNRTTALSSLRQRFAHLSIRASFGMFTAIQSLYVYTIYYPIYCAIILILWVCVWKCFNRRFYSTHTHKTCSIASCSP